MKSALDAFLLVLLLNEGISPRSTQAEPLTLGWRSPTQRKQSGGIKKSSSVPSGNNRLSVRRWGACEGPGPEAGTWPLHPQAPCAWTHLTHSCPQFALRHQEGGRLESRFLRSELLCPGPHPGLPVSLVTGCVCTQTCPVRQPDWASLRASRWNHGWGGGAPSGQPWALHGRGTVC